MNDKLTKYEKVDYAFLKVTYMVALGVLVALVIWGGIKLINFWRYEETNDAQIQEYINPILSRVSGFVQMVHYSDHQYVQKGDTLVVLDTDEAQVDMQKIEAEITSAEAQLQVMRSNVATASSSASISQAKISAAKAELIKQQKDYARYKKLLEGEAATQEQFEAMETRLNVAQSNYHAVKNVYANSLDILANEKAKLAVAKATIAQKKALLEQVKLNIRYAAILAPSSGYLGKRKLQEGEFIQKGQTIGFMVDQQQGKWVIANFQETQIADMHQGQKAKISVDAYPGEIFYGKIESFSPATGAQFSLLPSDNATGNFVKVTQRFPVRINFTEKKTSLKKLRAGMNVEVSIVKD